MNRAAGSRDDRAVIEQILRHRMLEVRPRIWYPHPMNATGFTVATRWLAGAARLSGLLGPMLIAACAVGLAAPTGLALVFLV